VHMRETDDETHVYGSFNERFYKETEYMLDETHVCVSEWSCFGSY
jgi:hypothetical protein